MRKTEKATTKCHFEGSIQNQNGPNSRSKGPRIDQKTLTPKKTRLKKTNRSWAKLEAKSEILEGRLLLDIPIRTVSEANSFEPWQKRHGRHKDQQRAVGQALSPLKGNIRLPCRVRLTRFAPNELDAFDNLPMSFKYIVDAICAIITGEYRAGKADSDKRISISCGQEKSVAYGIRIEIEY